MNSKRIISLICAVVLLFSMFSIPASANSRAQVWRGTDANGVVFRDGDVPIQVESELLTFDLPTLPYVKYRDAESFLAYDSKVTAEYTFYNPTDMTITATLLFPFGTRPEYAYYSQKYAADELDIHGVYVNGEKINADVRYTDYSSLHFNTDEQLATLSDEFIVDDFYTPDLTVTKYSYEIVGQKSKSAYFNIEVASLGKDRVIVLKNGRLGGHIKDNGNFSMSDSSADENEKLTVFFYVLGRPLTTPPDAGWYERNGTAPDTKTDGKFTYLGTESSTLRDLIFNEYDAACGVSEVDWYNACIANIKSKEEVQGTTRAVSAVYFGSLMRWYEYEITLQPGEKIKNTVTAPMYPQIEAWDQPYEYNYTYLLSPASGWADFGRLDIVINTPYEMSETNLEGFEKTENGYRLTRDGLPTDENGYIDLHFTLLNDGNTPKEQPNPNKVKGFFERAGEVIASFFIIVFMAIVSVFKWIVELFIAK